MAEQDTLAGVLEQLRHHARERDDALQAIGVAAGDYPHLPVLEELRRLRSRQRAREQLRATLQPPPAGAGPLNSASLAHRALALMRTTSTGYLQHFTGYLDTLSWLEQMNASGALQPGSKSQPPARGKRPGGRKRKASR